MVVFRQLTTYAIVLFAISWRTPSLFLFPVAALPSALYTFWSTSRKSVLITDILGLSFTHNALALLKIDSFKTGTILLSGLFVYDIWWVFGTEVVSPVQVEKASKLSRTLDGESSNQSRYSYKAALAKVFIILRHTRVHDAWPG